MTRQECINVLKEICQEIGCSGMSPKMCNEAPHECQIIRRIVYKKDYWIGKALAGDVIESIKLVV